MLSIDAVNNSFDDSFVINFVQVLARLAILSSLAGRFHYHLNANTYSYILTFLTGYDLFVE